MTGLAGPLHSCCNTEIHSLSTAGLYLFPCCSLHICACAKKLLPYLPLLFKSHPFLSSLASLFKRRKTSVVIPPVPFSFCLLSLPLVKHNKHLFWVQPTRSLLPLHFFWKTLLGSPECTFCFSITLFANLFLCFLFVHGYSGVGQCLAGQDILFHAAAILSLLPHSTGVQV